MDVGENTLLALAALLNGRLAGVPVDGDLGVRADLVSDGVGAVTTTLVLQGRRATGAAENVVELDGTVVDVDVTGRRGVLDLDVSRHGGLSEAEEGTERDQLHFRGWGWRNWLLTCLFFSTQRDDEEERNNGS